MIERSAETKETIVVPIGTVAPNHLEFKVVGEADGTFTVVEYTAGDAPTLKYTGFPNRREAEKFVSRPTVPVGIRTLRKGGGNEFEIGDLVKVRPTHAKSGMLAVVKSTVFSGLNVVEIETENGETLQIAGRHLEKTKLPKAIVDMATAAVKAKMAGRCPMKEDAPCLS